MDRTNWFITENITTYDLVQMSKDPAKGIGWLISFILGQQGTYVWGFGASQTATPSLAVKLNEGLIYALAAIDATPVGALVADPYLVMQQGWTDQQEVLLNTSGISAGQSQWWLIQCEFEQRDIIRPGDPWSGKRGFYNSTDPSNPLDGINGLGAAIPTVRQGFAKVTAKAGVAATTESHVPPSADSGCVPLYLVELTNGQTTISTAEIQLAGPSAYAGYPDAPFIAGLLNGHHRGIPGHAPQIVLGGSLKEVQGVADIINLPATNTSIEDIKIPTIRWGTTDPNVTHPGEIGDLYVHLTTGATYSCKEAGGIGAAVWTSNEVQGDPVVRVTTFPYSIPYSVGTFLLSASADGVVNLPANDILSKLRFRRIDTSDAKILVTPTAGVQIENLTAGVGYPIYSGQSFTLVREVGQAKWWLTTG